MSKVLTDKELLDIVRRAVEEDEIDCLDSYLYFMEDLGNVIAKHFGGERGTVDFEEADDTVYIAFQVNENVPENGGIYKKYDTDVNWVDGEEKEN
jgi:hypothetical protein